MLREEKIVNVGMNFWRWLYKGLLPQVFVVAIVWFTVHRDNTGDIDSMGVSIGILLIAYLISLGLSMASGRIFTFVPQAVIIAIGVLIYTFISPGWLLFTLGMLTILFTVLSFISHFLGYTMAEHDRFDCKFYYYKWRGWNQLWFVISAFCYIAEALILYRMLN